MNVLREVGRDFVRDIREGLFPAIGVWMIAYATLESTSTAWVIAGWIIGALVLGSFKHEILLDALKDGKENFQQRS